MEKELNVNSSEDQEQLLSSKTTSSFSSSPLEYVKEHSAEFLLAYSLFIQVTHIASMTSLFLTFQEYPQCCGNKDEELTGSFIHGSLITCLVLSVLLFLGALKIYKYPSLNHEASAYYFGVLYEIFACLPLGISASFSRNVFAISVFLIGGIASLFGHFYASFFGIAKKKGPKARFCPAPVMSFCLFVVFSTGAILTVAIGVVSLRYTGSNLCFPGTQEPDELGWGIGDTNCQNDGCSAFVFSDSYSPSQGGTVDEYCTSNSSVHDSDFRGWTCCCIWHK